jgi:hypothetical protein
VKSCGQEAVAGGKSGSARKSVALSHSAESATKCDTQNESEMPTEKSPIEVQLEKLPEELIFQRCSK